MIKQVRKIPQTKRKKGPIPFLETRISSSIKKKYIHPAHIYDQKNKQKNSRNVISSNIHAVTGNWFHELLSFIRWEKERSFIHELSKYFPAPSDSSSERVRCSLCGVKGSEPEWFGGHSQYRVSFSSAASDCLIPID